MEDDKILNNMLSRYKKECDDNINNIDSHIEKETDYIQLQINNLNKKCLEMQKIQCNNDQRYKNIIDELNNLHDIDQYTDNNHFNDDNDKCFSDNDCGIKKGVYDDPTKKYSFKYTRDEPKIILVTAVGGGGAGGIGNVINNYYFSGGGGGAGACVIQRPVKLVKNTIITVRVGKGGNSKYGSKATDSYVKFRFPDCTKILIIAKHGECGKSTYEKICELHELYDHNPKKKITMEILEKYICHGNGGKNMIDIDVLNGQDGKPGNIAIPSFLCLCGGNGGNSMMYGGGKGGSNFMGPGGSGGTSDMMTGCDGQYGSGGGGSVPLSLSSHHRDKYSGNGGNGIVIIC